MSNINFTPIISDEEISNIIIDIVPINLELKKKNYSKVNEINNNKYNTNPDFKAKKKRQAKEYYNSRKDAFIELQELKKSLLEK
jgi:hypothetical protein